MVRKYRIYFNRKAEWPQAWAIDEGSQSSEINVKEFRISVPVTSHALSPEDRKRLNPYDHPFAWMECAGVLELSDGIAFIRAEGEHAAAVGCGSNSAQR